ncbi:MAG: hypothetical protein AAFR59_17705, partial [Bacteroidota bacterium]
LPSLFMQQDRILKKRHQMIQTETDLERRAFSENAIERIKQSRSWVEANRARIASRLATLAVDS